MPVYEFYCPDCHRLFNFMSRRMNTRKKPRCPKCDRPDLERQVSLFAFAKGSREEDNPESLPDIDETRLERVMEEMAGEADSLDEENPQQMGRFMRKLYGATGLDVGPAMDEAIRRMESGEDPDQIEQELGDALEGEDPFAAGGKKLGLKGLRNRVLPPSVDETLYDL